MRISNDEKRYGALEILRLINSCDTEEDIDRVDSMIDVHMLSGYIFKKDYVFLNEQLDNRILYLTENGII